MSIYATFWDYYKKEDRELRFNTMDCKIRQLKNKIELSNMALLKLVEIRDNMNPNFEEFKRVLEKYRKEMDFMEA